MIEKSIFKDGANKNLTHPQNEKGITLIALVVTIVVLLILAAVSISMLAGENGIIRQAQEAKEETESAEIEENEKLDNLEKYIEEAVGGDKWESILPDANSNPEKYKSTEQLSSEYIAIGTDGKPVNMDLWNPTKLEDGRFSLGSESNYGYKKTYLQDCVDGRISGTVPQYIYNEELGCFKEVIRMFYTFQNHEDLKYAPEIPNSVTIMKSTFERCTNLTEAPVIPSSVTDMSSTFSNCTGLTEAPVIPSGVTDMGWTFSGCTGLTEAPVIPNSVTDMYGTFEGCTSLTGTIIINANPTDYSRCFYGTQKPIILTGSSTMLQTLANTASNGNVTVLQ